MVRCTFCIFQVEEAGWERLLLEQNFQIFRDFLKAWRNDSVCLIEQACPDHFHMFFFFTEFPLTHQICFDFMVPGEVAGSRDPHPSVTFRCDFRSPEGHFILRMKPYLGTIRFFCLGRVGLGQSALWKTPPTGKEPRSLLDPDSGIKMCDVLHILRVLLA